MWNELLESSLEAGRPSGFVKRTTRIVGLYFYFTMSSPRLPVEWIESLVVVVVVVSSPHATSQEVQVRTLAGAA